MDRKILSAVKFALYLQVAILAAALFSQRALAQAGEAPKVSPGDTAWLLTSSALVLMMSIPGLFLFYGGLVRSKNSIGTMMQTFIIVALVTIQWALIGYTLSFGTDVGSVIGGLNWLGLNGVGTDPHESLG
ncbi:MAG: hypothetical protein QXI19_06675, partial [Candidatus Caldarchaeum sp.]